MGVFGVLLCFFRRRGRSRCWASFRTSCCRQGGGLTTRLISRRPTPPPLSRRSPRAPSTQSSSRPTSECMPQYNNVALCGCGSSLMYIFELNSKYCALGSEAFPSRYCFWCSYRATKSSPAAFIEYGVFARALGIRYVAGRPSLASAWHPCIQHVCLPLPLALPRRLAVSPTGGGGFMVYPEQNPALRLSNRVNLRLGASPDDRVYDCTCGWCLRWKMPCRHVLAAAKGDSNDFSYKALRIYLHGYIYIYIYIYILYVCVHIQL